MLPLLLGSALIFAASPVQAVWEHYITVGKVSNQYDPPFVHAKVGAKVKFEFFPKNHTVTQANFDTPCVKKDGGIASGFQPVADVWATKWFEVEVKDDKPMWFYCGQADHCEKDGMVFAINPPAHGEKTFDAFKDLAKKSKKDQQQQKPAEEKPAENKPSQEHHVLVGKNGNQYDPPFVHAPAGSKIKFEFFPKNHTVTQANFDTPCVKKEWAIASGFQFVANDQETKFFEFEVKDDKPMWFYCGQADHCEKDGMVFAVNPPAHGDKTFNAFQALAKSNGDKPNSGAAAGAISGFLGGDNDSEGGGFGKWTPVILGLLAGNLLISLLLVVGNCVGYCKGRGKAGRGVTRNVSFEPGRSTQYGAPTEHYKDEPGMKSYDS